MLRANSLEKTLTLGKTEGRRRRKQQRIRCLDGVTNWMDTEFEQSPGFGEGSGSLVCCSPWGHKELDTNVQLENKLASKDRRRRTFTQIFIVRNTHASQTMVYKILAEMSIDLVNDQLLETIVFFYFFIKLCPCLSYLPREAEHAYHNLCSSDWTHFFFIYFY